MALLVLVPYLRLVFTLQGQINLPVNTSVFHEMFFQVHFSTGRVITQHTLLYVWYIFDVMYKQMAISVHLLLKLAITYMALMDHR